MKRNILVGIVVLMLAVFSMGIYTSCIVVPTVELSGKTISKTYEVSDFRGLRSRGGYKVRLIPSDKDSVVVRTDSLLFQYLKVEKQEGALVLSMAESLRLPSNATIYADVYYAGRIEKIRASGASDVRIEEVLQAEKMELTFSGASNLTGDMVIGGLLRARFSGASQYEGNCKAEQAEIKLSGASEFDWKGFIQKLQMEMSGASNLKNLDMQTDIADIRLSGASSATITVNKELQARASGASDLQYSGSPQILHSETSGASSVSQVSR